MLEIEGGISMVPIMRALHNRHTRKRAPRGLNCTLAALNAGFHYKDQMAPISDRQRWNHILRKSIRTLAHDKPLDEGLIKLIT